MFFKWDMTHPFLRFFGVFFHANLLDGSLEES